MRQGVKFQLDRVAKPDRVTAVVLHRVLGQRMDQYVEPLAVQHQMGHDMLELVGLENDQYIGDRVRPDRRVAEAVDLDRELLAERGAHSLGDGARLCRVVVDVGVIAQIRDGLLGILGHRAALPAG